VAFATVCDVVPLLDENRILAYFGLKLWPNSRWSGLKALSQTTGVRSSDVTATTLGFVFGPRLNAAGRVEHASLALKLLLADETEEALVSADKLEELNSRRRLEQDKIERAVLKRLDEFESEPIIIMADEDWSHGVVGIVASRVMEQTGKPTYLLQIMEDGTAKGSARSFGDFSVAASLQAHQTLLISGGGHAAAGGLSLSTKRLGQFRQSMAKYHASLKLGDQTHLLKSKPDADLKNLEGVGLELATLLEQLQPFGQGNLPPRLHITNLIVLSNRSIGKQGQHARLMLADNQGSSIEAIMFNPKASPAAMDNIEVTAELNINDFAGRRRAELIIKDWAAISELPAHP
jgi:single-stranded-DNA-specific exonuclease